MTTLLEDVLFDAPDELREKNILVDRTLVRSRLEGIVKNTDLSRYIL
jgi:ATP-dependent HslUV protease ATP-binding subunit HslU